MGSSRQGALVLGFMMMMVSGGLFLGVVITIVHVVNESRTLTSSIMALNRRNHHIGQVATTSLDGSSRTLSSAASSVENRDIWKAAMHEKLRPVQLQPLADNSTIMAPHQVLHMHHMKTGGTSIENVLKCAQQRLEDVHGWTVPFTTIHECSPSQFKHCLAKEDPCQSNMDHATIMSFCAPLKYLEPFGWNKTAINRSATATASAATITSQDLDNNNEQPENGQPSIEKDVSSTSLSPFRSITVLRHPVDRVWSNYRFVTKGCYHCLDLPTVYDELDNNRTTEHTYSNLCKHQLYNHQTRNLLTSPKFDNYDDIPVPTLDVQEEMIREAISNLQSHFTLVGVTEQLETFHSMVVKVFPFVAPTIPESHQACHLSHSNSSPKNNQCGPNRTHMDLPDQPDEATRQAILDHNGMDLIVYQAAVELFQQQQSALEVK